MTLIKTFSSHPSHNGSVSFPLSPLCFSHPLPKAVLLLCKAVQMSLSPLKGEGAVACLSHCDRASSYMRSSIAVPLSQSGNWLNKVTYKGFALNIHSRCHRLQPELGVCFLLYLVCCIASSHADTNTHAYSEGGRCRLMWCYVCVRAFVCACACAQCGWQEVAVVHCSCIA